MAYNPKQNKYYRPFLESDSELSDSDNESYLTEWSRPDTPERPSNAGPDMETNATTDLPDFSEFARALQQPLVSAAGPTFATTKQEDAYNANIIGSKNTYGPFDIKDISGTKIEMTKKDISTVVMLQSRDRDRRIFSQPTNCQLFLPRVYKNISGFSLTQLNLTSAFFYFRATKENISIQIFERGRVLYNLVLRPPLSTTPLYLTNTIREGSYNISQLLAEIQTQLNRTPLFYDFLNGFADFFPLFSVNGDFSLNFNYPGDNYYDSVRKVFVNNPTKAQIVGNYFQSQFANQLTYTIDNVRIAYYYPVLKEAVLDPTTNLAIWNLVYPADPTLTQEDIIQYIVYSFTGLNDPVVLALVNQNVTNLDNYRLQHTFRYSLVNRYECNYNQTNNRVTIQTNSLNTSLVNLLNSQYNLYIQQQLAIAGLTLAQYNLLLANTQNLLSIIQSMYDYLQTNFAYSFAINYGTYDRTYFTDFNNSLLIRNGSNATGISYTYNTSNVTAPRITDYLEDFRFNPPYYWDHLSSLNAFGTSTVQGYPYNMGDANTFSLSNTSNFPYSVTQSNIDLSRHFVDGSGVVYTDLRRRAGDIMVNVKPYQYTLFKFRSKVRQTLQVETLPRQIAYRYPYYNSNNPVPSTIKNLFDISYNYINPIGHIYNRINYMSTLKGVPAWSNLEGTTTNFGVDYTSSLSNWGSNYETINATSGKGNYYFFTTPQPSTPTDFYRYDMNLTFQTPSNTNFAANLCVFLYHDFAAMNADISGYRFESPFNYKEKFSLSSNISSNTIGFKTYANQKYYLIVRGEAESFASTDYRIIPWFSNANFSTLSNPSTFDTLANPVANLDNWNFAQNNDPTHIRLPIISTLWSNTNPSNDFINNVIYGDPPKMGYDSNGVSSDLTDYIPFESNGFISSINPNAVLRADPINNYIFSFNQPYNTSTQTYIFSNTTNAIYTSNTDSVYNWTTNTYRDYKMVHYYSPTYLFDTSQIPAYDSNTDLSPYIRPYTLATTSNAPIKGYDYEGTNPNSKLLLGKGVAGFTFLPSDGTWELQRMTFKTSFITNDPTKNLNTQIQAIGCFLTNEIVNKSIYSINLQDAHAVMLLQTTSAYTDLSNLNLGFDASLGTYYTFSNIPALSNVNTQPFTGYSQVGKEFIADSNSFYTALAFKGLNSNDVTNAFSANSTIAGQAVSSIRSQLSNAQITVIQNITGSAIPYPYANEAFVSTAYYDGTSPPDSNGVVLSSSNGNSTIYGPPTGYDESIIQYAQSIPYANSHMHFLDQANLIFDPSGFSIWSNAPLNTNKISASVPGYMCFQDGIFSIIPYVFYTSADQNTPPDRFFYTSSIYNLTIDQIYPESQSTTMLAFSGNTSNYVFLGSSNNTLRFKQFTPATGTLTELPINPFYTIPTSNLLIQNFVFHNTNRWFLTAYDTTQNKVVLFGDDNYTSSNTMFSNVFSNSSNSILSMDPSGTNLHYADISGTFGFTSSLVFNFNPSDPIGYVRSGTGYTLQYQVGGTSNPTAYTKLGVTINSGQEELLLLSPIEKPNRFFKATTFFDTPDPSFSNVGVRISQQILTDLSANLINPTNIIGGGNGSKWLTFSDSPYIMGNRNDAIDAPTTVNIAYQIFFPTFKLQMHQLTTASSPIIDTTGVDSNGLYPEWPHVMMFGYSNYTSLTADISGGNGRWGFENSSNFFVSDVSFNGFYFNAYNLNFPLYPNLNCNAADPEYYYYLALRGYLPTEEYQATLRFYMPNRYDFGFVRFQDIMDEVPLSVTSRNLFNPAYYTILNQFNSNFVFSTRNFGSNTLQGYTGSNISSISFSNFMVQYSTIFAQFTSTSQVVTTIQSNIQSNINQFIQNDLQYILPSNALTRQRYTDPLLFQIRWKSALTPKYLLLDDEWGLGWNLGYDKVDTPFSTVQTGSSFFKIQQDFIYLRLNPEFNINRMDAGGKENYREGREPTGTTNQYYCKLLLTNFGGNATTFIHNPITFNPPLNRLTKLQFQWLFPDGTIIDNGDAEWNATVNVVESMEVPKIPDKMLFQPADPRTGNPAPLPKGFQEAKIQEQGERDARRDEEIMAAQKKELLEKALKEQQKGVRPMSTTSTRSTTSSGR
jgi:hypothetical protein